MGAKLRYELNGEMLTVKQLYERKTVMMHINLLYERLRAGMPPSEAISTAPTSSRITAIRIRHTTSFNKPRTPQ